MGGRVGQIYVKSVPYSNAGLQVLNQFGKTLVGEKTRKRAFFVMAALAAGILSSFYAIRSASKKQRQNYKGLMTGLRENVIYFPAPGKTSRDKGRLIKIRVSEHYATAGNLINMMMAEIMKEENFSGDEYLQAATAWIPDQMNIFAGTRMVSSLLPYIFQPWVVVKTGKKSYPKVMPLTPGTLTGLPIEEQYTDYTSRIAKTTSKYIGAKLNLNPIEIDYLIEGYLGGRSTRFLTGRMGSKLFSNAFYTDLYLGQTKDMEFFVKLRDSIAAQENLFRKKIQTAAAEQGKRLEAAGSAEAEVEAAISAGVTGVRPSEEFIQYLQFKPKVAEINSLLNRYRFLSRAKNPGPKMEAEKDNMVSDIIEKINFLRQDYEQVLDKKEK